MTPRKLIAVALMAAQISPAASPVFAAGFFDGEDTTVQSPFSADRMAGTASALGASVQGGTLNDAAAGMAAGQAAGTVQDWLSQFGTAQVNLRMDRNFSLKDPSADVLIPLLNGERNVLFTQVGMRDNDGYFTTNLGIGHRHFFSEWMLGANVFWDATWNNENHRYGVGLEAWRDYLKLSANGYRGMSGWHQSRQHEDYDERPADGWDVRAEGWLPHYPQLGGKLMFEQYYGREVALLSWNDRQKDPYAITVGASYTPVPLVTAGVDLKNGKSGKNDTQLNVTLNYQPGIPWHKQVNPDEVAALRSLAGSRLDLVSRNNNVVLDYRKQELITLGFPAQVRGTELTEYSFTPAIKSKYGVSRVELDSAALVAAGGKVMSAQASAIRLQLPAYRAQAVRLTGVAVDRKGNRSNLAETLIQTASARHVLTLKADKTSVSADGTDKATLTLHVTDAAGSALADEDITFTTDGGQLSATSGKTNSNGDISVTLSSLTAGEFHVTAVDGSQTITHEGVSFVASLSGRLLASKTTAEANGSDAVTWTVSLEDAAGAPVAGQDITWSTTLGTLSGTSGQTDAKGQLSVTLTSTEAGQASVTARAGELSLSGDTVTFTKQALTRVIDVSKTTAEANGTDAVTYTVTVRQADGTAVSGETITWETDFSTLSATSSVTNSDGQATVTLTSTQPGQATVTAATGNVTLTADTVTFTDQALTQGIEVSKTHAIADGQDAVTYTVTVMTADGAAVADQSVTWSTDLGTLSATSGSTDTGGQLSVTLTSQQAGLATVKATTGNTTLTADAVTFAEQALTRSIEVSKTTAEADGADAVTYTVTVRKADGTAVSGETVTWETDLGTLGAASSVTNSDGQATVTLTSLKGGDATVRATTGDTTLTAPVVAFATVISLAVTPDITTADADGVTPVTYTTVVTDAAGQPVSGEVITWATSLGTLAQASATTDSSGHATTTLTSTRAGVASVTAGGSGKSATAADVTFVAVSADITLVADRSSAETGETVTLTAAVTDHDGQPLGNAGVMLATSAGSLSTTNGTTNSDGQLSFTLTSGSAATATVTATSGDVSATQDVTFEEVSLTVSASAVDSSGDNANGIVFGESSPTYGWEGARLKLEVSGATGDVTWSSPSSSVSVSGNILTLNSQALRVTLTGTDTAGHTVTYMVNTTGWVKYLSDAKYTYLQAQTSCSSYGGSIMTRPVMQAIYDEWGNLYAYDGWVRQYYMTSTAWTGSTASATNNAAFWAETGLWVKNGWASLAYACY